MSKLPKIFLLPLIFILAVFLFSLIPTACLASMDFLDLQVPFGELPAQFPISGSSIAEYIKAVFLFGSSAVILISIIMIMYGGVLWSISGAVPATIEKAKDTIFKALLGLCIALFAIIILQVVAPGTILLEPLSISVLQGQKCCLTGDKIYEYVESVAACNAKAGPDKKYGKIVSAGLCVGELRQLDLSYEPSTEAQCKSHTTEADCAKDTTNNCVWKNDACFQDVSANTPTLCQEANNDPPAGTSKKSICGAVVGCVWMEGNVCQIKPGVKLATNPCAVPANFADKSACEANTNCQYYSNGACVKHLDTANINCDVFTTKATCPSTNCFWDESVSPAVCRKEEAFGAGCNDHAVCGRLGFCCKTGCLTYTNPDPSKYKGVCTPRITQGKDCYDRSVIKKIDDNACTDGKFCSLDSINSSWSDVATGLLPGASMLGKFICLDSSVSYESCMSATFQSTTVCDYIFDR